MYIKLQSTLFRFEWNYGLFCMCEADNVVPSIKASVFQVPTVVINLKFGSEFSWAKWLCCRFGHDTVFL